MGYNQWLIYSLLDYVNITELCDGFIWYFVDIQWVGETQSFRWHGQYFWRCTARCTVSVRRTIVWRMLLTYCNVNLMLVWYILGIGSLPQQLETISHFCNIAVGHALCCATKSMPPVVGSRSCKIVPHYFLTICGKRVKGPLKQALVLFVIDFSCMVVQVLCCFWS